METANSHLTLTAPDIWKRGVSLANRLTGYDYAPKLPLPDGTIYACGCSYYPPPREPSNKEQIEDLTKDVDRRRNQIKYWKHTEDGPNYFKNIISEYEKHIVADLEKIERLKKDISKTARPRVFVPEGAMEWLLHETGHWVAASPEERALPNYGYGDLIPNKSNLGDDREWQAWAFEEIILAQFGPARAFASPTWRDGVGFSKAGPLPPAALAHVQRQILDCPIDIQEWRDAWGDWVRWGNGLGVEAPWIQ